MAQGISWRIRLWFWSQDPCLLLLW